MCDGLFFLGKQQSSFSEGKERVWGLSLYLLPWSQTNQLMRNVINMLASLSRELAPGRLTAKPSTLTQSSPPPLQASAACPPGQGMELVGASLPASGSQGPRYGLSPVILVVPRPPMRVLHLKAPSLHPPSQGTFSEGPRSEGAAPRPASDRAGPGKRPRGCLLLLLPPFPGPCCSHPQGDTYGHFLDHSLLPGHLSHHR